MLADKMKEQITDEAPDMGASLYSDLLGSALQNIDDHEVATAFIKECIE